MNEGRANAPKQSSCRGQTRGRRGRFSGIVPWIPRLLCIANTTLATGLLPDVQPCPSGGGSLRRRSSAGFNTSHWRYATYWIGGGGSPFMLEDTLGGLPLRVWVLQGGTFFGRVARSGSLQKFLGCPVLGLWGPGFFFASWSVINSRYRCAPVHP